MAYYRCDDDDVSASFNDHEDWEQELEDFRDALEEDPEAFPSTAHPDDCSCADCR